MNKERLYLEANKVADFGNGWIMAKFPNGEIGLVEPENAPVGNNGEILVPKQIMDKAVKFGKQYLKSKDN